MAEFSSIDAKRMAGMHELYSKNFGVNAKSKEENSETVDTEQKLQDKEVFSKENEKHKVIPTGIENLISKDGNFSNIENFALEKENSSTDSLFSKEFKQRLLNLAGNSSNPQENIQKENLTKANLFEALGLKNDKKTDKISELSQVLDIEEELCNSLPEEAQGTIREMQGVRSECISSLMEQCSNQWGSEFGNLENLPDNIQQQILAYTAGFSTNIVQAMMDFYAKDNLEA